MGVSAPEQKLLDALKAYELQLPVSVAALKNSGTVDDAAYNIAADAANYIPGGQQALQVANQINSAVAAKYGAGSTIAMASKGATLLGGFGVVLSLLSGRTYESDNYWGAVFYLYFVKGEGNVTNASQVEDSDVLNALQWFIQKLGVFISGREHLLALQQSAQSYMNLYSVNNYTTQDLVRVQLAVEVMQTYMYNATIGQIPPGSWEGTVGVYDNAVIAALESARIHDPNALSDTTGSVTTGLGSSSVIYIVLAVIAVLLILFFTSKKQ